jgi:Helix-turn-helix domain of resolvase
VLFGYARVSTAEQNPDAQELYDAGDHTVQQIADLFSVPRTTVYGHLDDASKGKRPASHRNPKRPADHQPPESPLPPPAGVNAADLTLVADLLGHAGDVPGAP